MEINGFFELIDAQKGELFELLSELVKINSEGFLDHGNEEECARYIYDLCEGLGLESDIFSPLELDGFENHPDYMPGRALENRLDVVARWKGEEDRDELMLMAHTDTVPIGDPGNWVSNPLSGEIKDGKIFGRGACDDKYAIAVALFVIKLLKENGFKPKANVLFSAYSDEEYGGSHGAMAAVMKYPCDRIVSMDGNEGQLWHCGSGGGEMKYLFHTKDVVDSAKTTAKAIPVIMEKIEKFAENRRKELDENPFYSGTIIPETSLRYLHVRAGNNGMDLGEGEILFVYYTDKSRDEIFKELDEIDKEIKNSLDAIGVVGDGFKPNTRFFHYVYCEPQSEDVRNMVLAYKTATGACLSDLSVISKYGSSKAYGFGAGRDFSEEGGAHQPNEYIECRALIDYAKTIAAYIINTMG